MVLKSFWLSRALLHRYTLCDIVQGEDVFIPDRLMQHSILNQAHYQSDSNSSMTLSELVCVKSSRGMTDDARSKVDPIVDLVATLLLLCEVEGLYLEHGHLELLSPQLSETLVWCLSCVSEPYLMISEESYGQVTSLSPPSLPPSLPPYLPPSLSLLLIIHMLYTCSW